MLARRMPPGRRESARDTRHKYLLRRKILLGPTKATTQKSTATPPRRLLRPWVVALANLQKII